MAKAQTYTGALMVRAKGTGFVAIPDFEEDIVIPNEHLSFGLDGDMVEITLLPKIHGKRQEGRISKILEPAHDEFVGNVRQSKTTGELVLIPDNYRIHIRLTLSNARETDEEMKVVAKITKWKKPTDNPVGEIVEILGRAGDHETEMQAIIRSGSFSEQFPESISKAAQTLYKNKDSIFKDAVEQTKGENPTRRDFRGVLTMTIDPADAKDFDDALSIQKLENGHYEIGVHIADVSHYVQKGDDIDIEAQKRGTSMYLVDRVIPMLPEVLSNDLCSLRPNEDRLAFSVVFEIDDKAKVHGEWYGQTVINSDKRFNYEEAQESLDKSEGEFSEELSTLMSISRILRKRRIKNGAVAFDQDEVKFVLDEKKRPVDVKVKVRTETMLMIEDFMLLANKKVAEHIYRLCKDSNKDAAFVYRVHDLPDPEKIEDLAIFIHALGYKFKTDQGDVHSKDINKLLKEIEDTPEENLIKTATIRSMAKAIYSTKNIGHYGLAFKYYTHFTSPIRRYPDLMAHRMLRRHLDNSNIGKKEMAEYERLAVQSSEREMEAVKAERDSIKFKQVEFMQDKVGEEFDGVITGVADWGIYVEEKNSKAEGMVSLSTLKGDFFLHEAKKYRVKGEKSGDTYSLGQEVRVKLVRADLEERKLDFELI